MGNAVCRRCWDRVQIASRASENDGEPLFATPVLQIGAPRMMTVIVEVFGAFGLTVSERRRRLP